MGCLNGYSAADDCAGIAGIDAIKLIPYEMVTSFTPAGEDYSAAVLETSEYWKEYDIDTTQPFSFVETKEDGKSRFYNGVLTAALGAISSDARTAFKEMLDCGCGLIMAIKYANGNIRIVGETATGRAYLTANENNSGANETEEMAHTFQVSGRYKYQAKFYTGTWESLATAA